MLRSNTIWPLWSKYYGHAFLVGGAAPYNPWPKEAGMMYPLDIALAIVLVQRLFLLGQRKWVGVTRWLCALTSFLGDSSDMGGRLLKFGP